MKPDSIDSHVEDTLIAGLVFCDRYAVEFVKAMHDPVCNGYRTVGFWFDTHVQPNGEEFHHLTREGGHSHRHSSCRRRHR